MMWLQVKGKKGNVAFVHKGLIVAQFLMYSSVKTTFIGTSIGEISCLKMVNNNDHFTVCEDY